MKILGVAIRVLTGLAKAKGKAMTDTTKTQVRELVVQALTEAASKDSVSLEHKDVPLVASTVVKEVGAVIDNLANTEAHWYQKRSRWAAIIAMATPIIALIASTTGIQFGPLENEMLVQGLLGLGNMWAAYVAYRAGVALKPLGM